MSCLKEHLTKMNVWGPPDSAMQNQPRILCLTRKMSQTRFKEVKGAAMVTMVTSGRYPTSYLECFSLLDSKNIAHVESLSEFICVPDFVIEFVFVFAFMVDF